MDLRQRIELGFVTWGHWVVRHRLSVVGVVTLLTALACSQLPRLWIDNSIEGFLLKDDPTRVIYDEFRQEFGRDERAIIAIRPQAIFDFTFLEKLKAFHEELEGVRYVAEVDSMINARNTRGEADELIVEDLLENWPETDADLAVLKARVLSNPLYENLLISEAGTLTTVSIELQMYTDQVGNDDLEGFDDVADAEPVYLSHDESIIAMAGIREIMARYEAPDFELYLAGAPALNERLNAATSRDMVLFTGLSVIFIAIALYGLFRRMSAVIIPIAIIFPSLLVTLALMAIMNTPMSTITSILPGFLLTVGICDSIHLLTITFQEIEGGRSKNDAIARALGHSGLAILMTSVTTAGGLASFSTATLAPIRNLGLFAPAGVMLAFIYSVTLLPALLSMMPLRVGVDRPAAPQFIGRVLAFFASISTQYPWRIVFGTVLILLLSLSGILRLNFSHNAMTWFPKHEPLRIATGIIDKELRGTLPVELLIRTGTQDDIKNPERLNQIDEIKTYAETLDGDELFIGKAVAITDIVKETHKALNEGDQKAYVIPQNDRLVAQELLLFENSGTDDLEDVVDSQFSTARISMKVPQVDAMLFPPLLSELETHVRSVLPTGTEIEITGLMTLLGRTFTQVLTSMVRSYVLALLIITPLMMLLLGSLRGGLVSMVPNLTPIILTLGLMGWFDIPLDGSTLLVGGILLGVAVDDTIHFMHNFARYYAETGDAVVAVNRSLQTAGAAMFLTSLVLVCGFGTYVFGYMLSVGRLGYLSAFTAIAAFLADITIAPALMVLVSRWKERRA